MQVDAPEFYQLRFFEPLSEALFLEAINEGQSEKDGEQLGVVQDPQRNLEQQ